MKTWQSFLAALLWALLSTAVFAQLADQYKYTITGGVSPIGPSFTATKNGSTMPIKTDESIQTVITAIISDAMANVLGPGISPPFNIGIQFGNGTNVLDIGQATASFSINGPGTLGMNKINFSGKITSTAPASAAGSPSGTVIISSSFSVESSADIANTTAGGNAICIAGGEVKIFGGTVTSTNTGYAIDFPIIGGNGQVVLGGSPTITGTMQVKAEALSVATDPAFTPAGEQYTIKLLADAVGSVAVKGGADFISNFTLADSPNLILAKKDNDLVLAVPTSSSSSLVSSSSSEDKSSSSVAPSSSSSGGSSSSSAEPVPIAHTPLPTTHSEIPTYYTMKGEPVGSTKPAKPGVYLVKQGSSVRKIVVR